MLQVAQLLHWQAVHLHPKKRGGIPKVAVLTGVLAGWQLCDWILCDWAQKNGV